MGGTGSKADSTSVTDVVAYRNSDKTTTVYLKCNNWFAYDFSVQVYQSTVTMLYDGTHSASTPTGTLATAGTRLDITKDGVIYNNVGLPRVNTANTWTALNTFNAPTNVNGQEVATTTFKTANGGQLIVGKEGPNSGTRLRFDQVAGTPRLLFRATATAGAMVWSQPEKGAALYFDLTDANGNTQRSTLSARGGEIARTSDIPSVSDRVTKSTAQTITGTKEFSIIRRHKPYLYLPNENRLVSVGVKADGTLYVNNRNPKSYAWGIDYTASWTVVKSWNQTAGAEVASWKLSSATFKYKGSNTDASYLLSYVAADSTTVLENCKITSQRLVPELSSSYEPSDSPSKLEAGATGQTSGTRNVTAAKLLDVFPCD